MSPGGSNGRATDAGRTIYPSQTYVCFNFIVTRDSAYGKPSGNVLWITRSGYPVLLDEEGAAWRLGGARRVIIRTAVS